MAKLWGDPSSEEHRKPPDIGGFSDWSCGRGSQRPLLTDETISHPDAPQARSLQCAES
jgi:hypothetical protein